MGLFAALALAQGGVQGCGADDERTGPPYEESSAEQVVRDVNEALDRVESVRVHGVFELEPEVFTEADLRMSASGCVGGLDLIQGGSASLVVADGRAYLAADELFWIEVMGRKEGSAAAALAGDRWVTNSALPGGGFDLDKVCNMEGLLGAFDLAGDDVEDLAATTVEPGELDGAQVVVLTDPTQPGAELYVAADDPHHPVRIDMPGYEYADFSDFDEPITIEAPPRWKTLDMGTVGVGQGPTQA